MKYSRNQINKAGKKLLSANTQEEREQSLDIINDWRSLHLHPLETLKKQLVRIFNETGIKPILISQRLKRLSSIEYKLDLNPEMGLGGMQDIGGFRAVLKDMRDLYSARDVIMDAFKSHTLERITDYVDCPKQSGYRSIHLVYRYKSKNNDWDGARIELQIRTKLQHNWATAVETAGIYTKTSLKSSQGADLWLDSFKVISSLFAIIENAPVMEEHRNLTEEQLMVLCYEYNKKLNICDVLKALRVTIKVFEEKKDNADYYLLNINFVDKNVSIETFSKSELSRATQEYMQLEQTIEESKNAVVLVATASFEDLREAYPSYFLDTSEFIVALENLHERCEDKGLVK